MAGKQPFYNDNGVRQGVTFKASAVELDNGTTAQQAVESLQQKVESIKQSDSSFDKFKNSVENKFRKSSTAYSVGNIAYLAELPTGFYLECNTPGTTSSGEITLPDSYSDRTSFMDGTVGWTIKRPSSEKGSEVSFTRSLSSGTKVATIIINGTSTDLYSTDNTTYSTATANSSGLMSAADKKKLNSIKIDTNGHITTSTGLFGFRIDDLDSNPISRVEYLYDATNMTPVYTDFSEGDYAGVFDYGSWKDIWFVKNNKPLMLKSSGAVDYYLNPDNYLLKEGSTATSDVANMAYDGNAMAQIPLIWVKRYQEGRYKYVLFCETKYDSDFKAYAHTDVNGSIKNYFYWGMFLSSGNATKLRSIGGAQTKAKNLIAQDMVNGASANGTNWYIGSWSQRSLITDMFIMLAKSTDIPTIFGKGHASQSDTITVAGYTHNNTGDYSSKGQFYGVNNGSYPMKAFHMEDIYGDQWENTAGMLCSEKKIYVKMTPEGDGYKVTDINGYIDTGLEIPEAAGYITKMDCSEYGLIPVVTKGSATTFYCDNLWIKNDSLKYVKVGASASNATNEAGPFAISFNSLPTTKSSNTGCRLAYV